MKDEVIIYHPGKRNIGRFNRLLRFSYGFFFLSLSLYLWAGFSVHSYGTLTRVFLLIPLYVGFLGIYQALFGFSVYHARKRTYDMR